MWWEWFYLFVQLTLVNVDLLGGLFEIFLQQKHVLLVFFALQNDFLNGAFLLAQNLDGLSMSSLLFVQFQFQVTDASLHLGDDATASNNGVGLNFFQANGKILKKLNKIVVKISFKIWVLYCLLTLTSTSKDFLMVSILTMRSCSSCKISTVCLSSTCKFRKELIEA